MVELGIIAIALCFGLVVFVGAPYLPSLQPQTKAALDLLDLKPGQTLLELGSGDGKVAKAAARRGLNVVGYELNPILVLISKINTYKYRTQIKIKWKNFWKVDLPPSDGAFVFLLERYMQKLDKKIIDSKNKPKKLASLSFVVPGKKIYRQKDGVYLYLYH